MEEYRTKLAATRARLLETIYFEYDADELRALLFAFKEDRTGYQDGQALNCFVRDADDPARAESSRSFSALRLALPMCRASTSSPSWLRVLSAMAWANDRTAKPIGRRRDQK